MGSPENDTIIILLLNEWLKMREMKREKSLSEFCASFSPFLPFLPSSLFLYVHYIRHIIYSRVCRRSHGVRGATNRILRRWRRSKTKPNKARGEEERTKGSLSFAGDCTSASRYIRGRARMRAASHLRIMSWEIEYLSRQEHFPGSFLPPGDPWPRGPAHPGPRARGHFPALWFSAAHRAADSADLKVGGARSTPLFLFGRYLK